MSDIESSAPVAPEAPAISAPPAATPAPETPPTAGEESEGTPPDEGKTPEPERTFTQSELDKIVQTRLGKESRRAEKLAEARIRAEYAERQLAALTAPAQPQQPSGAPQPNQFQDWESYNAALVEWKVDQKLQSFRQETELQQRQRAERDRAAQILPKVKSAQAKYDDFQEVATSFDAPQPMQAAMLKSEIPGELYYYFGNNPAELDRVSRLDPIEQIWAVKEIASKLTAAPSPTKVPAPIKPDAGGSRVAKKLSEMTQDEFEKARAAYRQKRR